MLDPLPPPNRAAVINRIDTLGMRPAADALRDEIRKRHQAAGKLKPESSTLAWAEMWDHYRPIVEYLESVASAPLRGTTDDLTPLLDPDYSERDPGKRLRDGLLWTAEEIRRVVVDAPDGTTTIDLARASTPPPTAWAVFCLESYARKPVANRGELIAKVLPFATRQHDPTQQHTGADEGQGGFLEDVE